MPALLAFLLSLSWMLPLCPYFTGDFTGEKFLDRRSSLMHLNGL